VIRLHSPSLFVSEMEVVPLIFRNRVTPAVTSNLPVCSVDAVKPRRLSPISRPRVPVGARSTDHCQEDALSSPLPENVPPSARPAPQRQRLFVAEITCLLCGRQVGTARAERWPPAGSVLFRSVDSSIEGQVATISRLRCPVCGGNTTVDELTEHTVRVESPTEWQDESKRRGRPPKWLVELRKANEPDSAEESDVPPDPDTTCLIAAHWQRAGERTSSRVSSSSST
jgi:hypothetical protein